MSLRPISDLPAITPEELSDNDSLLVSTPDDTDEPAKKISAKDAFNGGGGGSSTPDITITSACSGLPGDPYDTPVIEFNAGLDDIVDKVDDCTLDVKGFCACVRGGMPYNVPIYLGAITTIPQATISAYGITSLTDAVLLQFYLFNDVQNGNATMKVWDNLVFYTEGDSSSQHYGEIVQFVSA